MLSLNTIPYAYADNLEYHCEPRFISSAADANQAFHRAWRQLISYGKSWSWATSKAGRTAWERYNVGQPDTKKLPFKTSGIDLGTVANYTGFRHTENQEARIRASGEPTPSPDSRYPPRIL